MTSCGSRKGNMINCLTQYIKCCCRRLCFPDTLKFLQGILLLLLLASCKNKDEDIRNIIDKNALQEDRAEEVTIIYSEGGKVNFRLFAKELVRNEMARPPYADLRNGLKLESFNDSMEVESTLTARYARYYEKQQNVLLRDSIVVVTRKGERLSTEELVWNQKLQKFYTEKPVSIRTATQVIYGNGLEANQDFTWYEISQIRGSVRVKKDEMPE
ncbi:MAG: LPS export ABC transporter periplasmic protein LptC [Sphingobacteriales bacterium]|nr:MAG: LPS export ABC transporter periplasmic protein LptC [Sphingobacteriales bacterium]